MFRLYDCYYGDAARTVIQSRKKIQYAIRGSLTKYLEQMKARIAMKEILSGYRISLKD